MMRAAAAPYPGERHYEAGAAVPGHAARVVPDPAERACSGTTKAGEPCKGRPGDDGRCAAHKDG
jgi:hypothetical protein